MPRAASKSTRTRATPYDVAEHLRTPEEMAAYLDAWLEEAPDDAAGIAKALGDIARAKGMSQVAKDAGLSRESLYRALSADAIQVSRRCSRLRVLGVARGGSVGGSCEATT
jgi:probable addiction module antidote protein